MTNGLLRSQPQPLEDRKDLVSAHFHRNEADRAFMPAKGPTVVVRHRRLVLPGAAEPAEGPSSGGGPAARIPRVHTLGAQDAAAPVPQRPALHDTPSAAPLEHAPELAAPSQPSAPRRRKRNELHAPRLLRHVVFERVAPVETPGPDVEQDPGSFLPPVDARSGYEAVCRALNEVREALAWAHGARRFRPVPAAVRS
jgi:hypothetical protein